MPAKKQTNKRKQTKSKAFAASKKPMKKTPKKKLAVKTKAPKKLAKKKAAQKVAVSTNTVRENTRAVKTSSKIEKRTQDTNSTVDAVPSFQARHGRALSGRQSGDLQGLSRAEGADSESVDELLEEGNPFEADVVTGVEDAENSDEREVRTHEVPEDDVPDEYLDKE